MCVLDQPQGQSKVKGVNYLQLLCPSFQFYQKYTALIPISLLLPRRVSMQRNRSHIKFCDYWQQINQLSLSYDMKTNKMNSMQMQQQRAQDLYKKLSEVSNKNDLKRIMKTTTDQNKRLTQEIKELRDRVATIRQKEEEDMKQKQKSESGRKQAINEVTKLQSELDNKYKKMKELKEKIAVQTRGKIEDVENNKMKNMNEVANVVQHMEKLQKDLKDLEKVKKKLEKTFADIHKEETVNEPRVKELQAENLSIRNKISSIRKADQQKEYDSIKVQTTLIGARTRVRDNEARKSMFNLKTATTDKRDILALQKYEQLSKEVEELKKQTEGIKQIQQTKYEEMKKIKARLLEKNRELVKNAKQLEGRRTKMQQENNLWRKKWQQICKNIEALKNKKVKVDQAVQFKEYEDRQPLRRDFAGILNRHRFEDRVVLGDNKKAKIVGMIIYETERGIICLQALYSTGEKSYVSIPAQVLERVKMTKIETSSNDFFKLFKVKYNMVDNKITKIQIRSNRNIKYQYGDKKPWSEVIEGDTIYGFDIGVKEYPVCIFGSYHHHKGQWFLEGFGVEINQLDELDRL